jgi:phosphoinositide-3-kinase regulatory subunit 4
VLAEKLSLKNQPNVLGYHRIVETDRAGYLVRQYCYSNLADRISTRPFFSNLGKKWIAYQILQGLSQMRSVGLYHGDIKAENIVLTGWDWVFLTDIATFKPVTLPADDPSNFAYFFDTAERRICLIAPERFYQSSNANTSLTHVTEQMDVFSVGCVLAQLYLEGEALFDLSQLLAYRKGDTEHLNTFLNRIDDVNVREMIAHMLQIDPEKRFSAKEYIQQWTPSIFPHYFETLHSFMATMAAKSCDERIITISKEFDSLISIFRGVSQEITEDKSKSNTMPEQTTSEDQTNEPEDKITKQLAISDIDLDNETSVSDLIVETANFKSELDHKIKTIRDTDEVNRHLESYKEENEHLIEMKQKATVNRRIENDVEKQQRDNKQQESNCAEGTEIIASILCSSVRNARSVSLRVKGLALMQQIAEYTTNYTRLQRLVPYTCVLLNDPSPLVKTSAIRTLTFVLSKITKFPTSEANLFNDYILPALRTLATDSSDMVRVTFAEHLPLLAYEARRFFEMGEVIKQNSFRNALSNQEDISSPIIKGSYDSDLNNLHDEIGSLGLQLSMDECAIVKSALLKNILKLCTFYGRRKTNEFVLPMIITFLNSKEWRLREAFFEQIVGISVFVGPTSLKEFILPCILQALYDSEEFVIEQALNGLVALCELGMFEKRTLINLARKISPLLHHPNTWVRYDAIAFFAAMSKQLGLADTSCFLMGIIQPHLDHNVFVISENSLLESVKQPIARHLYDKVLSSPMENLQDANAEDVDPVTRWKQALTIPEISPEDAEKLDLMKPYIDQAARSMMSKLWDTNNEATDISSEPIKLNVPLQSYFIPIESPFVPPQTNIPNNQSKSKDQKSFNNEWNALFNRPAPKKLVRASIKGTSTNSPTTSPSASQYTLPALSKKDLKFYRPSGQICAQSQEHKGAINEIAVHDSLTWFVTGGNDGTVRLWDLRQQERDYSMISKLTCNLPPTAGKAMSVAVLSMSSPLIAAATDRGSLHFFSADLGTTIYQIQVTEEGAQFMQPFEVNSKVSQAQHPSINVIRPFSISSTPLLMVGNQSGSIIGIDPRVRREAFLWRSKDSIQQGPITSLCGEESWMVSGTRRGFLTLWDLRFQIGVSTSRISHTPIYRMGTCNEPTNSSSSSNGSLSPSIYVAAGTRDIKLWDLESRTVSAVYRCYDKRSSSYAKSRSRTPSSSSLSETTSSGSSTGSTGSGPTERTRRTSATSTKDPFAVKELERINWEDTQTSPFEARALYAFPNGNLLTGSSDCRIRYWDRDQVEQSYVVSGLESTETCQYTVQTDAPTTNTSNTNGSVSVNTCMVVTESIKESGQQQARRGAFSAPIATRHSDTVTDIKIVGTNAPMLLSASRDGVLKMWL